VKTTAGSALISAVICALLWLIISFATGGSVLFSVGGAIVVGAIVFGVGYAIRRLVVGRRKPDQGARP
jgi:hypothetical protein